MVSADSLSATFAALADPTRRAMLRHLARGNATVTELAEPFDLSLPTISKHLKVLERAGLVTRAREAQFRPVQIRAKPLREAAGWIEAYRELWEHRFDRMAEYLEELQKRREEEQR